MNHINLRSVQLSQAAMKKVHAIVDKFPNSGLDKEYWDKALCGTKPNKQHGHGFLTVIQTIDCKRCLRKLSSMRINGEFEMLLATSSAVMFIREATHKEIIEITEINYKVGAFIYGQYRKGYYHDEKFLYQVKEKHFLVKLIRNEDHPFITVTTMPVPILNHGLLD